MSAEKMILRSKAINYFQNNNIAKSIELSLNDLFKIDPSDPYGFLSEYFERLSALPKVNRVEAFKTTGGDGCVALKLSIYGNFKNVEVILASITIPSRIAINYGSPLANAITSSHEDNICKCIDLINGRLSDLVVGMDPRCTEESSRLLRSDIELVLARQEEEMRDQRDNESKKEEVKSKSESAKKSTLKKGPAIVVVPDDPPEVLHPLLMAHSAVSMAMAVAASFIDKLDLCEWTKRQVATNKAGECQTLPLVSVLYNGKGLPGKCQMIRRCLLLPNGLYDSSQKVSSDIRLLCLTLFSNLQIKMAIPLTEYGELIPAFDRPDQFLDAIEESVRECGLQERMRVVLEVGARGIFDMDKGKYEVLQGQMKTGEEMAATLIDLVDRYPIIAGLVDPLRTQDKEAWRALGVALDTRCWLMGRSPGSCPRVAMAVLPDDDHVAMSVMCLAVDGHSLYSEYLTCARTMADAGQALCLWLDDLSTEYWPMDLAGGIRASLVAIPGPRSLSGASKLNRWTELSVGPTEGGLMFPELYHQSDVPTETEDSAE